MSFLVFGLTGRRVVALLLGLAMVAGGCWLVRAALLAAPLDRHVVYAGLGVALVGAALVIPAELFATIRGLGEALAPSLRAIRGAFTGAPPALPDLAVQDLPRAKAFATEEEV